MKMSNRKEGKGRALCLRCFYASAWFGDKYQVRSVTSVWGIRMRNTSVALLNMSSLASWHFILYLGWASSCRWGSLCHFVELLFSSFVLTNAEQPLVILLKPQLKRESPEKSTKIIIMWLTLVASRLFDSLPKISWHPHNVPVVLYMKLTEFQHSKTVNYSSSGLNLDQDAFSCLLPYPDRHQMNETPAFNETPFKQCCRCLSAPEQGLICSSGSVDAALKEPGNQWVKLTAGATEDGGGAVSPSRPKSIFYKLPFFAGFPSVVPQTCRVEFSVPHGIKATSTPAFYLLGTYRWPQSVIIGSDNQILCVHMHFKCDNQSIYWITWWRNNLCPVTSVKKTPQS